MSAVENESSPRWERAFAGNMARLRAAQGLSQNEFAKRISSHGLSFYQATVQRIEDQERSVRLDEARVISEELGVSLDRMIRDESGAYGELLNMTNEAQSLLASVGNSNLHYSAELNLFLDDFRAFLKEVPEPETDGQKEDLERANRYAKRLQKVERQVTVVVNSVEEDRLAIRKKRRGELLGKGIGALIPTLDAPAINQWGGSDENQSGDNHGEHQAEA